MERLTYNLHPLYTLTEEMQKEYIEDKIKKLTDKVGKYEDLEEQIGCPLEVLFRALNDGIYKNKKYGDKYTDFSKWGVYCLTKLNGELGFIPCFDTEKEFVALKDYKKSWWLKADRSE